MKRARRSGLMGDVEMEEYSQDDETDDDEVWSDEELALNVAGGFF